MKVCVGGCCPLCPVIVMNQKNITFEGVSGPAMKISENPSEQAP